MWNTGQRSTCMKEALVEEGLEQTKQSSSGEFTELNTLSLSNK